MSRRQYAPTSSNHTTSTRDSRRSDESYDQYSYDSRSTAPSSLYDNLGSTKASSARNPKHYTERYNEDLSPSTSLCPRSSVETYSSKASADEIEDTDIVDIVDDTEVPPLPIYRHEITDSNVRPSSAQDFAALFPSMNRLSIRHDDFTSDGNMNLRVDTIVSGRRRRTVQLFHLRMYDLNKREFSLRRKSKSTNPAALRVFRYEIIHEATTEKNPNGRFSVLDQEQARNESLGQCRYRIQRHIQPRSLLGEDHEAAVTDKLTGVVSFHLFRDGPHSAPVAHIVPETRSPNQVASDENAGGWVPPCHMWLSDKDLIDAATDVADPLSIVVATGLMALVDDCIKQRWSTKHTRQQRITLPKRSKTLDYDDHARPRSLVHKLFSRRHSDHSSPLQKTRHPVVAY
ncbi:hypothetical protein TruAng_002715 [Truncatella angustata]|nr:hypothetical protein TruAng_002715 [Truncatella angustata]